MTRIIPFCLLALLPFGLRVQGLPTDGPLTLRLVLQQLGERLLQGK